MDVTNLEQNFQEKITLNSVTHSSANKLSLRLGQYFWSLEDILYAN